ncbi:MAG: hypothetical protein E6713_02875 [Sporomusaceae bacterium]|nr:hypothetical protein [Sporomusaceae bacterium]
MAHGKSPHSHRLGIKVLKAETEAKVTAEWESPVISRYATPEECEKYGIKGRPGMNFSEALDRGINPKNALKCCDADTVNEITKERLQLCLSGHLWVKEIATGFNTSEETIYQYFDKYGLKPLFQPQKVVITKPEVAQPPQAKPPELTVDIAVQFVLSELEKKETVLSEKITALMAEVDTLNTEAKNIEAARSALGKLVG